MAFCGGVSLHSGARALREYGEENLNAEKTIKEQVQQNKCNEYNSL